MTPPVRRRRRSAHGRVLWTASSAGLLAAALGCAPTPSEARASDEHGERTGPSVLLVTLDTLRADVLSGWGGPAPTPTLEALAARGVRFAAAFSASSCTAPSHASLLTGLPPSRHTVGLRNGHHELDAATRTLAEALADAGWDTGAVVSNAVLTRQLGLDQGFAHYDDRFEEREANRDQAERRADRAVDAALAWLLHPRQEPFFFWLHLQDAHGPYLPPPPWGDAVPAPGAAGPLLPAGDDHSGDGAIPAYQLVGEQRDGADYRRRYLGEVAWIDHQLGRLLDALAQHGLDDDLLVIVTADHGEALGEDGFWFAHGHSVGRDQVWVPLLVAGPGVRAGAVVEAPVANTALFATVLEAAGLPLPAEVVQPSLLAIADDPRRAPPVWVESLNQVGLASAAGWLRRDRRPPDDRAFWDEPNPNSGGSWRPLGEEHVPAAAGEAASLGSLRARLLRLLDASEDARRTLDGQRVEIVLDTSQRAALESLGYAR